jgi:hypothetical protein
MVNVLYLDAIHGTGGDATNITLLAEWSASSAMPQEILATELHTRYNFSISWYEIHLWLA